MRRASIAFAVIFLVSCGGGSSSTPTSPTAAAPTITTTADMVYVGQTITFAATGQSVRWGGDNPGVATVDATTGSVSGVGIGRVTIWAENSAGRTTRLLRGLPSYQGSWLGSYAITGCQANGDFATIRFCTDYFTIGETLGIRLQMTQSRDQMTAGTFWLGDLQGTLAAGTVNDDGTLPLTGRMTSDQISIGLENFRAGSPSPGTMNGHFDQVWSANGATGTGRLMCDIRDLTRTGGAPTLRPGLFEQPHSLDQAVRAARRR
jgi:hypothetical protein